MVTKEAFSCSMSRMVSAGFGTSVSVVGSGRRLRPSAWNRVGVQLITDDRYPLKVKAHRCTRTEAVAEMARCSPKRYIRGLWSE